MTSQCDIWCIIAPAIARKASKSGINHLKARSRTQTPPQALVVTVLQHSLCQSDLHMQSPHVPLPIPAHMVYHLS